MVVRDSTKTTRKRKYIFGPVPSRRLGRSLGVDIIPFKTCTYDCIYCQLGRTTNKTVERKEYVPVKDVLAEIKTVVEKVKADYVTLSGSGEPTLNSEVGKLISGIKKLTPIPVAVLTSGALLSEAEVRSQLSEADVVIPSLDAGREEIFQKINRPHSSIRFGEMVEGLIQFRREFKGKLWLEIMFVDGMNTSAPDVEDFAAHIGRICPDCIHLNTVVRPPAEESARIVPEKRLQEIRTMLGPRAELIAKPGTEQKGISTSDAGIILDVLRRRPCTVSDLKFVTGLAKSEILKHISLLMGEGTITAISRGSKRYYRMSPSQSSP